MNYIKCHRAFTLIELIFVIVILGVVASIGSSIIAQVFGGYITQRSVHDASLKTELAINQLSNRLSYRINDSLLARDPDSTGNIPVTDYYSARNVPLAKRNTYSALEWISYDSDSFEAFKQPRWSGFCDLGSPSTDFGRILSIGSKHTNMYKIKAHYNTGIDDAHGGAIRFMTSSYASNNPNARVYDSTCMYAGTAAGCMFPVGLGTNSVLSFPTTNAGDRTAGQMVYSEFYQYAISAFAVVPENKSTINGVEVFDLNFYYGYQPWEGEYFKQGKSATLIKNVSVFRFRKEQNSIRLKICVIERISDTDQISICKEKAVIR